MFKVGSKVLTKVDEMGYYKKWCGARVPIIVPKGTSGMIKKIYKIYKDSVLVDIGMDRFVRCKKVNLKKK